MCAQLAADANRSISAQEQESQLDRILSSCAFQTAPSLQKFLDYVTHKSIAGRSSDIKEYAIAIDVFLRSPDYDPKTDTIVRTQAHRLREKLLEYYEGEGVRDQIVLEIPRGHYVPCFRRRATGAESAATLDELTTTPPPSALPDRRPAKGLAAQAKGLISPTWFGMTGIALLLLGGLVGYRAGRSRTVASGPFLSGDNITRAPGGPLLSFWGDFIKDANPPLVAFSDSVFLSTQTGDLFRLKSGYSGDAGVETDPELAERLVVNPRLFEHAGPVFYEDLHSGTGEVMAAYYLTRLFTRADCSVIIKRSRLVSIDDLQRHNAIFVGSTREDALLAGLPLNERFIFREPANPRTMWGIRIVDLHPEAGEKAWYEVERDEATGALRADYALVSILPGISPNRKIMILGGLTTVGTQAAAEFVTSSAGVEELLSHLHIEAPRSPGRALRSFQAVLRVEIMKGEALSVKYVTGRVIRFRDRPNYGGEMISRPGESAPGASLLAGFNLSRLRWVD